MGQEFAMGLFLLWGIFFYQGAFADPQSPAWWEPETSDHVPLAPSSVFSRAAPATPHAVKVSCEPHRLVVAVHRDLFGVGRLVAPADLTLGAASCVPVSFAAGTTDVVLFEAGLHQCGIEVQMTPEMLIYRTSLFHKPSPSANPIITRTNAAEIPIECHYPRKGNVSSLAIQPTWAPFRSTVSAEARLGFSLRLMNDDWSGERLSSRFQLGEILHLQARVEAENHLPLRLFVDSCVASPEATLGSTYAIVDSNGCLVDGRQEGVSSAFLAPRVSEETLRFTVDAFRFAGDSRNMLYVICHLKVTRTDQTPDVRNKACSFDVASSTWLPVEGPRSICSCCEARNCDRVPAEQTPSFLPRPRAVEMSWQRSLPAELTAPQAHLTLGPFFVFDSLENSANFPADPAGAQKTPVEDFMPAMESKVDVMRNPVPFKDPGRSANISEEQEDNPELPLDVYLRRGPVFISEAEEGSGFPDLVEAARPEARKALELKAEVVTMTLEGAVSRAENRTTSRTGELTATTSRVAPKTGWMPDFQVCAMVVLIIEATVLLILLAIRLSPRHYGPPCVSEHNDIQRF
ncbi:zona pellucida sperm-binding protein 3-like [Podarcis raffonei]|uniref:zona pellucida sperm-binding protein 3-like n=1 Tax=Podarcis raffonei TaxID=65483 RepID=UPI00232979C6|nr:zona pellucida sperm-binding protein 3-like [Podarcis raffonei]